MNLFTASRSAAFATKLFAAAGLDFAALVSAGDENALKAHLTKAAAAPVVAGALTAEEVTAINASLEKAVKENETLAAQLSEQKQLVTRHSALVAAYETALATAKITPKAADAAKGLQASDVTAALNSRISMAAGEELAKHGLTAFPEQTVEADPTKPAAATAPKLTGLARTIAALKAESAARAR